MTNFTYSIAVGTNDQNRAKNQSDTVIPFDRNRVILTPDNQRQDSTYINASFIEGYHNDESFIITQVFIYNPLEYKPLFNNKYRRILIQPQFVFP